MILQHGPHHGFNNGILDNFLRTLLSHSVKDVVIEKR